MRIWRIRPLRNCGGDWKKVAFSCKVARRSRSSSEASAALVCCCCLSCVDCCGPCCKTAAADVCSSRSGSPGGAGVSATVRVVRVGLVVCGLSGWWPADSPSGCGGDRSVGALAIGVLELAVSVLEVDEDDEALLSVGEDGAGGGWSSGFPPSAGIGSAVWGVGWLSVTWAGRGCRQRSATVAAYAA